MSLAPSPHGLASSALDRYVRIHSTFPPPTEVGQQQERQGAVLEKIYLKSTPTVVVWDQNTSSIEQEVTPHEDDDVWGTMESVEIDGK